MMDKNIAAVIVSGGYSSRMGNFKPLLEFGNKSAIQIIADTYKNSGINNIIVVTGYRRGEIEEVFKGTGVKCIYNENYANGMFTSVREGVKVLEDNVSAFFMHPVDIPLIKQHTIEVLKDIYSVCGKGIIHPHFCGRVGHPPLIDCKYKNAILSSSGEGGLRRIIEEYSYDSAYAHVLDKAVVMDMDTKEDYEEMLKYYGATAPDMEECFVISDMYAVPENIRKHCMKVAELSIDIFDSLDKKGFLLNEYALMAAAMLHDIAKKEKDHAKVGENILKEIGYDKVGSIIGSHTDIEVDDEKWITENEILYLADKLVKEDKVISMEERFGYSLKKYKDNKEAVSKIRRRMNAAYKIVNKIQTATGKGFKYV